MVEINHAIRKNGDVPEDIKLKAFRKLFIGGLANLTNREDLVAHFSVFGPVANAYVIYDPITRQSKSSHLIILDFGYVEFKNASDATIASECKEHIINGKKATLQFFKAKEGLPKRTNDGADYVEHPVESLYNDGTKKMFFFNYTKAENYACTSFGVPSNYASANYSPQFAMQHQAMAHLYQRESVVPSGSEQLIMHSKANQKPCRHPEFYAAIKKSGITDMSRSHKLSNIRFNYPQNIMRI
jgi:RNA recognition motif-containing protein